MALMLTIAVVVPIAAAAVAVLLTRVESTEHPTGSGAVDRRRGAIHDSGR